MLQGRQGAAIWSTWHLLTLFGFGLACLFVWMAYPGRDIGGLGFGIAGFLLICAFFWLVGTRARHPAWVIFLAIAALAYVGSG